MRSPSVARQGMLQDLALIAQAQQELKADLERAKVVRSQTPTKIVFTCKPDGRSRTAELARETLEQAYSQISAYLKQRGALFELSREIQNSTHFRLKLSIQDWGAASLRDAENLIARSLPGFKRL